MVPHLPGVPRPARRHDRPRARADRDRPRLSTFCSTGRRWCSKTTSRSVPSGATRWQQRAVTDASPSARGTCSLTRCCRRARRTSATCSKGAASAARSVRSRRSPTRPIRSAIRRSSRSCSAASGWSRSSTGAATATRSTRCPPSICGKRPTAARCSRIISAKATSRPAACPPIRTRRRSFSPAWRARLAARAGNGGVLLMNGIDHALPDAHVGVVAERLAAIPDGRCNAGCSKTSRAGCRATAPRFRGELVGARSANLLPGVWSTRTPLKLRNRRAETLLEGWAEPWCALGSAVRRTRRTAGAASGVARAAAEPGARLDLRLLAGSRPRADAGALRHGRGTGAADHDACARTPRRPRAGAPHAGG